MARRRLSFACPICKKPVATGARDFPFCSERCRTIDLGKWASGKYVINSPITDAEEGLPDSDPDGQEKTR